VYYAGKGERIRRERFPVKGVGVPVPPPPKGGWFLSQGGVSSQLGGEGDGRGQGGGDFLWEERKLFRYQTRLGGDDSRERQ